MRILIFSYDTTLLEPGASNESQTRQQRYCELLDQQRLFVVMSTGPLKSTPLRRLNDRMEAVGVVGGNRLALILKACRIGIRVGRSFRPDFVEYQDPQLAGLAAWFVSVALKIPLLGGVFTDFFNNPAFYTQTLARRFYRKIGEFVLHRTLSARCCSRDTANSLKGQGFPVSYVPFFVPDVEGFRVTPADVQKRLQQWEKGPVILCVARLFQDKNIEMLLDAFAALKNRRGRLKIIGRGPLKEALHARAKRLGIYDSVEWIEFVDEETLRRAFAEATIFAFASNFEASSRVLIQSQTAQLPAVATATSGAADIVIDNVRGFITPVGKLEPFVAALDRLGNDKETYRRFAEAPAWTGWKGHGEEGISTDLKNFYADAYRRKCHAS